MSPALSALIGGVLLACPSSSLDAKLQFRQPEYARPHVHQWEKAKTTLISAAEEIDGMIKEAKSALSAGSPAMARVLNRKCLNGTDVAKLEGEEYIIDNSELKAATKGVGYRFSTKLEDRDLSTVAHWGTIVRGKDNNDGWIKVGDCFLPKALTGKPVVLLRSSVPDRQVAAAAPTAAEAGGPAPIAAAAEAPPQTAAMPLVSLNAMPVAHPTVTAVYRVGENAEVRVGASQKETTWVKCSITAKGDTPNTYDLFVPSLPGQQELRGIPAVALRKEVRNVHALTLRKVRTDM